MTDRDVAARYVPVTLGSSRVEATEVPGFHIARVRFPPRLRLPPHTHERPTLAVILGGSFVGEMSGAEHSCPRGTMVVEPAGEPHGNAFDQVGAEVLIVQPDPAVLPSLEPFARLMHETHHIRDVSLAMTARRAAGELGTRDSVTRFAVEGLILELLSGTARACDAESGAMERRTPYWLTEACDLMHDRFREPLTVTEVAKLVEVHPVHLARTFRSHYGISVGTYLRALRLDWAAASLATAQLSIADIAVQAGFFDQSHFTRSFKRQFGRTPMTYRKSITNKN
jgi:AraC family transcriptional regulator